MSKTRPLLLLLLLLCTAPSVRSQAPKTSYQTTTCEGQTLTMKCKGGALIDVLSSRCHTFTGQPVLSACIA